MGVNNMLNSTVSVIITSHKGSQTIERAVNSVLNQDYENIELIVVDDNGIGTKEQLKTEYVLDGYIKSNKIIYIAHKTNRNGSVARNTGFRASKGSYVGFLDDDDMYCSGKIKASVNALENLDDTWGAVYTNVEIRYDANRIYQIKSNKKGNILYDTLKHTIFMNPSTLLIRRQVVELMNGFDESFLRHQDFEYNSRLTSKFLIYHVNMIGSIYNCQIKRHSNPSDYLQYRGYYMQKMKDIILKLPLYRQNIVLAMNAIDIFGIHIKDMERCRAETKKWLRDCGRLAYFSALFSTICLRLKYKLSKTHK